jgi:DNA-binding LacI/PurR family transcriptional regulator
MNSYHKTSVPEQVAVHLRREMEEGRLAGVMPGVLRLETELGVNRKTVEAALRILEKDGWLVSQGAGKRRRIRGQAEKQASRPLKVGLLLYDKNDQRESYVLDLRHALHEQGHAAHHPLKTLMDMRMEVGRIARLVRETTADAWVVQSGSQEVLEWFSAQDIPVMALFGRRRRLPLASVGPDKIPAIRSVTKALIQLGHRRIVFLTRAANRLPIPSIPLHAYLDELTAGGVQPTSYNLPDWKETLQGFHDCLESLFRVTAPTAVIVDGTALWIATQQFLASRKLIVPQDISMICTDGTPDFAWCQPAISHIRWDSRPVVSRIVRWTNQVAKGKQDRQHVFTPAEFVRGGTIGPVNTGSR